jgi:hypothetical protein
MSWWERERLAELRMQDRMLQADRERMIRQAGSADARHTGLLSLVVAWFGGRFLAPTRRRRERCCIGAGQGPSSSEPHGSLIL